MASNSNLNGASTNSNAQSTVADFSCSGRSLATLTNMLKALHCGKKSESQLTSVCVDQGGMAFTTSKAKCMTARCYLRTEYFSSFTLNDEFQIEFTVDISTLIQVLTIFGMESHFTLEFNKSSNHLQVFLINNEQNCITECQLFTYETAESAVDLQWSQYRVINQLSAKSEFFRYCPMRWISPICFLSPFQWTSTNLKYRMFPGTFSLRLTPWPGTKLSSGFRLTAWKIHVMNRKR